MTRMFPFITETWNPLGGSCIHRCYGCWAQAVALRYNLVKYFGLPSLDMKQLKRRFKKDAFVFVQDMNDLFADNVPFDMIRKVINKISLSPQATFLLLTKNPRRYAQFLVPENVVLGSTIETDLEIELAGAPKRIDRIDYMTGIEYPRKMVSIEPIKRFSDPITFAHKIINIRPEFVAVGYDNYNNGFDEPTLKDTETLIALLEQEGIKVYRKTIREKVHRSLYLKWK